MYDHGEGSLSMAKMYSFASAGVLFVSVRVSHCWVRLDIPCNCLLSNTVNAHISLITAVNCIFDKISCIDFENTRSIRGNEA